MKEVNVCDQELNAVMDREAAPINSLSRMSVNVKDRLLGIFSEAHLHASEEPAIQPDGSVHVPSVDHLPKGGPAVNAPYKTLDSMDLYRYIDDAWKRVNPYGAPVTEIIEDDTARMPHGGIGSIAIIHNVNALRRDLYYKRYFNWRFEDMVPRDRARAVASATETLTTMSMFFRISHHTLFEQLRTAYKAGESTWVDTCNALHRIGVTMTIVRSGDNPQFVYKDGDFEARWI